MIVASIMLSAAVYVSTFDQPPTGASGARQDLQRKAQDSLDILYDTPMESTLGENALSVYINECLNDDCDRLTQALRELAPEGAGYALYVSNGYETFPVYIDGGEPTGEAVAASRTFEPQWSSTFVAPAADTLGSDNPLLVYALPIFNSNPVTDGGSQLLVKVHGTRSDGSDYVLITSATTQASSSASAKAASLYFVDAAGNPMAVTDVTAYSLNGGAVSRTPIEMRLRLNETQGMPAAIPDGAEVSILMPRGWTGAAVTPVAGGVNDGWTLLADATDEHGSYVGSAIKARLDGSLSGAAKDLVFNATYLGDSLDHYNFHAVLSNGAAATASMIVTADNHASAPSLATPSVILSVPKPMGKDANTTWTLGVMIPKDHSSDLGIAALEKTVTITRIEIIEEDGNPIFAAPDTVVGIEDAGGAFTNGGSTITWLRTDGIKLDDATLLNLTFSVKGAGYPGPGGGESHFVPPVTFDAWSGRLVTKSGPGFYRSAILPADADYQGFDNTVTGLEMEINGTSTYRSTSLVGSATYTSEDLASIAILNDALYGSYVNVEERRVPVGGTAILNANIQSVLFSLASAGQNAGVKLRIYPPWAGDARTPFYTDETVDSEVLAGEVTQLVVTDINEDGYPDPIVGTTNGRIFSLDGLSGARLSGSSFSAPLTTQAQQLKAIPRINQLALWTLGASTPLDPSDDASYIVAVTDKNSDGVFVLNHDLSTKWSFELGGRDGLALDASQDITGDGEPDLIVAALFQSGATNGALVFVLEPPELATTAYLEPYTPTDPDAAAAVEPFDFQGFYMAPGTASSLFGIPHAGQTGTRPGLAVTVQTTLDTGLVIEADASNPQIYQGSPSLPRAGLQGLDNTGKTTTTFFGAPVTTGRPYTYLDPTDDGVSDVLIGSSSGYVILANGTALTQPIYSYVPTTTPRIVSAHTKANGESYFLASDGRIAMTDDAWQSTYCPVQPVMLECAYRAVGANAIASNATGHFWVVGQDNLIVRTNLPDESPTFQIPYQGMPHYIPEAYAPLPERAGLPYVLATHTHDMKDVWFSDDGQTAYIVGAKCSQVVDCEEGLVMTSADGGSSWDVLTQGAGLQGVGVAKMTSDLNRIRAGPDGTMWIVGEGGTILRKLAGAGTFYQLDPSPTAENLRDIGCDPEDPAHCIVVGDASTVYETTDALGATPTWTAWSDGISPAKTLYSVGFATSDRIYIGGTNAVFASFEGARWTALPLNYLQMDGVVVSTPGDGTGFVYGGGATGRIWLLQDFLPDAQAELDLQTKLPPDVDRITEVKLLTTNLTLGIGRTRVEAATSGDNWLDLGNPSLDVDDVWVSPRNYSYNLLSGANGNVFAAAQSGNDLRLRVHMDVDGDKTLTTPILRDFRVAVHYLDASNAAHETTFWVDPAVDEALKVGVNTTLTWDAQIGRLQLPYLKEYWTRNVSGSVGDLQTGWDVYGADGLDEVWVGTGEVLAENSPDYAIYIPDATTAAGTDDRVRLLNGRNGDVLAETAALVGPVSHLRLSDSDDDGDPDILYATAVSETETLLYALDPITLAQLWSVSLAQETPADMEVTRFDDDDPGTPYDDDGVFVGGQGVAEVTQAGGHIWAVNSRTQQHQWAVIPDDLGKYYFEIPVDEGTYFGAYITELEVSWDETVTDEQTQQTSTIARSARFYDHFVVTPPDLLSPPSPVYSARLVMWMKDWG